MSLLVDYGLDSPARSLPILALSLKDRNDQTTMGIMHIQKVMRYFEYLSGKGQIEFSHYKYGAVSYELVENIQTLEDCGLVEEPEKDHLRLTDLGCDIVTDVRSIVDDEDIKRLAFAKNQLNDLPLDELMFFLYKLLPETREHSTQAETLEKRRVPLSRSLFMKGRINSVTAAKWSGMTEKQFLASLSK
jgi:hypothetical protein